MTTRTAPFACPIASMDLSQIRAALPVAANPPLKTAALTANWLTGCGTPLAVDGGYWWFGSDLQTRVLKYAYRVDSSHPVIGVYVSASARSSVGSAVSVLLNGTTYYTIGTDQTGFSVIHYPVLNLSDGELQMDLTFSWNGGITGTEQLYISNILIYETPITTLEVSGVGGIESGNLIYDGYDDRESISGLERAAEELRASIFRRGTLFNWCAGNFNGADGSTAVNTTSTTFQEVFPDLKPAIQTRLMYNGETVRSVRVAAFAYGEGEVKVSMTNGDNVTLVVDGTGGEGGSWYFGDLDVETDDPSRWGTDGGVRGGTRDEIQIEYRATTAFGIILVAVSIYELPGV